MSQIRIESLSGPAATGLRSWIVERHYSKTAPPGFVLALNVALDGQRIGGMLWGRPAGRGLDPALWLCLDRLCFVDDTPRFVESQAIAAARKYIRKALPRIKGLVSYADPAQGHSGGIYEADGWAPFGTTGSSKTGWGNRPGRASLPRTPKKRWIRSP